MPLVCMALTVELAHSTERNADVNRLLYTLCLPIQSFVFSYYQVVHQSKLMIAFDSGP